MEKSPVLDGINGDVVDFVMARWQESGGFGFAPTLPPSVEDTYHALRILEAIRPISERELRRLKGNPNLKAFLMDKGERETWSLRTAYQYLALCAFCGVSPDQGWLKRFLEKRAKDVRSLREWYDLERIRREYPFLVEGFLQGMGPHVPFMEHRIFEGGQPEAWKTAEELWMCLYLHEGSPGALHGTREDLTRWLQACQTPDGGFGCRPGTTSFVENGHWSLRALALLGAAPRSSDRARDFILGCKARGGGFARKNGGAPFLHATWHAVAALSLLRRMPGS